MKQMGKRRKRFLPEAGNFFPAKFLNLGQEGRKVRRWFRLIKASIFEAWGEVGADEHGAVSVKHANTVHFVLAGVVAGLGIMLIHYAVCLFMVILYGIK